LHARFFYGGADFGKTSILDEHDRLSEWVE
jgi:hypothetical protein